MDFAILNWLQVHITNGFFDPIMVFITHLGDHGLIWVLLSVALLFTKKYRKWGILALLALLCGHILGNVIIKPWIQRPRPFSFVPDMTLLIPPPTDFSFPSGHTMSSFIAATVFFFMDRKMGLLAYCLAALISFSRLYLYVHFPSDVLSGAILGVLLAWGLCLLFLRFCRKQE